MVIPLICIASLWSALFVKISQKAQKLLSFCISFESHKPLFWAYMSSDLTLIASLSWWWSPWSVLLYFGLLCSAKEAKRTRKLPPFLILRQLLPCERTQTKKNLSVQLSGPTTKLLRPIPKLKNYKMQKASSIVWLPDWLAKASVKSLIHLFYPSLFLVKPLIYVGNTI